ncbi:hypothetical protein BH11ARM2_BH11ARM2_23520 [soil metagenome]
MRQLDGKEFNFQQRELLLHELGRRNVKIQLSQTIFDVDLPRLAMLR